MGKGGESDGDADGQPSVLSDPRFLPFQQENFDVAEFTSRVLAGSHTTAQAQSEQLRDGVRVLEAELSSQVIAKQKPLLGTVRRLLETEASLQDVVLSVESLQSAVRRIRSEIVGPYEQVKYKTRQLRNLHTTVELLRNLIHRLKLAQKLRQQLAAPTGQVDLAKAAKLLTDIKLVDSEVDLSGIEVVAADEEFLKHAGTTVREQAEAALLEGMESLSQAKVGSALQVFFNLDELSLAVGSLLSKYLHDLEKAVKSALDSRHLSGAAAGASGARAVPAVGTSGAPSSHDKLWAALKEVCELVQSSVTAVWHLQRVVAKKRDPLSHVCFLDVLVASDQPLLTQRFWSDVVKVLGDAFTSVSKPSKGGWVREALANHFPRLAQVLEAMFDRLVQDTSMKGVLPAVSPDQLQQLLGAAAPFQHAYLAACLTRMSDAVVAAFPGGSRSLPSPADVQKCIGTMHEELKVGGSSPQLAAMAASTVGKALALLAERAEYMAASGPDLRLPTGVAAGLAPANAAQARNIALCSQLQEVHRSLSGLLPRLPFTAAPALSQSLEALQATAVDVVAPIFKSAMEAVEERIMRIHSMDLGSEGGAEDLVDTSAWVAEVSALINNFRSEYLSKFVPPPSPAVPSPVASLAERMAARTLTFFVRHAALLRPLGARGRLQLAKDMAELQLAVGGALFPLEQLGAPYRVLKALRALLFAEAPGIPSSPLLQELPPSVTLHHLFSRLPTAVQAPHERSGLTPAQYSLWLDQHTQEETLASIRSALDAGLQHLGPEAEEGQTAEVIMVMRTLCTGQQVQVPQQAQ